MLLTEPPLASREHREKMLGAMLEEYGFQGAFVQSQAVLTLYSQVWAGLRESNRSAELQK